MMTKYEPLRAYLVARQHLAKIRMTFAEITGVLGESLPESAFKHAAWWANQTDTTNRSWAAAWIEAGYKVDSVHQTDEPPWVEFIRQEEGSGFAAALDLSMQPNYLGSPDIVSKAVGEYIAAVIDRHAERITFGELDKKNIEIGRIFGGEDQDFTIMPGWHNAECLGSAVVVHFNMDSEYFAGESLIGILSEGFAAVSLQIGEILDGFQKDPTAQWDPDGVLQIKKVHQFVTTVLMGTNDVYYPGKKLKDFRWGRVER